MKNTTNLSPKSVLITGASTGIGEACAIHLDKLGFRVFAGVRKEEDGQKLSHVTSEQFSFVLLDVTQENSIRLAKEQLAEKLKNIGLFGLVNNAGIVISGPLEFLPISDLRRQFEINVFGQIAVTQAFLPLLRQGKGRVVNIGSIGGKMALPFIGAYTASKFALEALTDSLRIELKPWNIPVTILEPGSIKTPLWKKSKHEADEIFSTLPSEGQKLYGEAIRSVMKLSAKIAKRGSSPNAVAKVVEEVLQSDSPKTRYLVGRDAQLQALMSKLLPDSLLDRLISKQLNIPK